MKPAIPSQFLYAIPFFLSTSIRGSLGKELNLKLISILYNFIALVKF